MTGLSHVHFVGVGGAGMSALAHLLLARGWRVSGCDARATPVTARLQVLGAEIQIGHSPDHLREVDRVIVSRAVGAGTDELRAARTAAIPLHHRAELLAEVMAEGRGIAVAGTHGKTTITAMIGIMLAETGLDPTALVGAEVPQFGGNARVGGSEWIVAEVDESDGSLLHVAPWAAVIPSLDLTDHADFYVSAEHLTEIFRQFLQGVRPGGFAVLGADQPALGALRGTFPAETLTYALHGPADLTADVTALEGAGSRAVVRWGGRVAGTVALRVPGRHNVANALAATAVGTRIGLSFEAVARGLAAFRGVERRFEIRGEIDGVLVVDDYAHNPVKIAAALRAARESWPGRRIVAIFQPHRYTRTGTTYAQFAGAFADADDVVVTDIYAAGEPVIPGVSAQMIVDAVRSRRAVRFVPSLQDAMTDVAHGARRGDLILTLGAGDIGDAAEVLIERLAARLPR